MSIAGKRHSAQLPERTTARTPGVIKCVCDVAWGGSPSNAASPRVSANSNRSGLYHSLSNCTADHLGERAGAPSLFMIAARCFSIVLGLMPRSADARIELSRQLRSMGRLQFAGHQVKPLERQECLRCGAKEGLGGPGFDLTHLNREGDCSLC